MSDIKTIANKYLETASKLKDASLKYIVGLALIVLFCWSFAEQVFYKTKFEAIRLNKLEQKIIQSKDITGKWSEQQHNEYDSLKKKRSVQDSVNAETYKAVEDNIPPAFKFLLKQATRKPFGILLTTLTTLVFLIYLFNIRQQYLNKLALGLRIIKEEDGGYNKIYDYNIAIPFWASPIPQTNNKGISKSDVIIIGGLGTKRKSHYLFICLALAGILIIQIRLYYISLITNSVNQNWILFIQSVALFFSLSLVLVWLLASTFRSSYKHEQSENSKGRRNFITISSFLIGGAFLGKFSGKISNGITKRMLKPRFRKRKKKNKITDCRIIELKAQEAIKKGQLKEAAEIIYAELTKEKKCFTWSIIPGYLIS